MESILSNPDIGIYMSNSNMAYLGLQTIQCSRLFGRKFGGFKFQIKSSTWLGMIHYQPRLIWFAERSLLRAVVMLANFTKRMWFMPWSIAQLCNLFGSLELNGITTHFRRAPLSLIFLSLFLQVIGNPNSLLLCYGLYGIEGIICTWASLHSHSVRWLILLKIEFWRELLAPLSFNNHDPIR